MKVTIKNKTGLHARPAAMLVNEANLFDCEIQLIKLGNTFNVKSIMSIMSCAVVEGDEIEIRAIGQDAEKAEHHLVQFLENLSEI